MIELKIPLDVSILLDTPASISLYIGDEDMPSHSVNIVDLVRDWLDCVVLDEGVHAAHTDEAYQLIKNLRDAITLVTQALPE